jgi:hypothetical protein
VKKYGFIASNYFGKNIAKEIKINSCGNILSQPLKVLDYQWFA